MSRLGLWRLTRNRYGRAVYDALARVGVTATAMYEYVAELDPPEATESRAESGTGVGTGEHGEYAVEACEPGAVEGLDAPVEELRPGETVLATTEDGTPRGYLFLSVDAAHDIHPLERRLRFEGAYIRRVFVDPAHRNRGIATALVGEACRRAAERGAARATALVAADNVPSRALFERHGFEARRVRRYVRVGPLSRRSVRPV